MNDNFEIIKSNIKAKKYPRLGSGSGRTVYDLGNSYVVKVAKNRKGIEQNKAEYQISKADHSNIFAEVLALSECSSYLVMEKAQRISSFAQVWNYYHVQNNKQLFSQEEFRKLLVQFDLLTADLYRLSSWGIVNGRPVIIDYGFTKRVIKFYRFGF